MTMTRKDFEAVAGAIREARGIARRDASGISLDGFLSNVLTPMVASALSRTNDRFNVSRFITACKKEPE